MLLLYTLSGSSTAACETLCDIAKHNTSPTERVLPCAKIYSYRTVEDGNLRYSRWSNNATIQPYFGGEPPRIADEYPTNCYNSFGAVNMLSAMQAWAYSGMPQFTARQCVPQAPAVNVGEEHPGVFWRDDNFFKYCSYAYQGYDVRFALAVVNPRATPAGNGLINTFDIYLHKLKVGDAPGMPPHGWYHSGVPPAGSEDHYIIDLGTVLRHEYGHVIGLGHPSACTGALMGRYDEAAIRSPSVQEFAAVDTLCASEPAPGAYHADYMQVFAHGSFVAIGGVASDTLRWEEDIYYPNTSFKIYRSEVCGGPYIQIASVPRSGAATYTYVDVTVQYGKPYEYIIEDEGDGWSERDTATPVGLPAPPVVAPPSNLSATSQFSNGEERMTLSWAVASGADMYYVYSGDVPFETCDGLFGFRDSTVAASWTIVNPSPGLASWYRVRARSGGQLSEWTNQALGCIAANVAPFDSTITLCPAGDADTLKVSVHLASGCGPFVNEPSTVVSLSRRGDSDPTVGLLTEDGLSVTDVLFPNYNAAMGEVNVAIARAFGCGLLRLDLVVDGVVVVSDLRFQIRSPDTDSHARGSVDRFDLAAFSEVYPGRSRDCWDLNWMGLVSDADSIIFMSHYSERHHVSRELRTPNGGETYAPGDVVPITWQAGQGDSARVTLRVVYDSPADAAVIAADLLDTGAYNWTVPATNKAWTRARVEVVHSAGYYKVDNAHVGTDASDDTLTFRATPVADLVAMTGKNTAVLTWSDPAQGTLVAEEHEIWYRHTTPLTDANYTTGSLMVASPPAPYLMGTPHCVEINSLSQCKTYYFAMRTKDRGVWSKLSNVAVAQTACSGFEVVFCEESGLLAGGGGGEGEVAQATRLASAGTPLPATGAEVLAENSLLCGSRGDMVEDQFRLSTGDALSRGVSEVVLRESALREAEVDAVGLGMVAHPSGTEAVPGGGTIWVGASHPIDRARDATAADVAAALAAAGEAGIGFRGGDVVTIEPGGDTAGAALVVESRNRVFAARDDSSGILIQRPDRSGAWSTVARIQPRREFDRQAIPTEGASTLRLVFLKEYSVRAIERLEGITAATPRALSLADASHSRLGSVDGAVDRSGGEKTTLAMGDTLVLRFTPLEPEAGMEHSYFFSIRGAVETAAEDTRVQDAASLVVAAGPAISNSLGAARPNPTAGGAVIAFTLAAPGQTELSIYDVSGRRIRTVQSAELPIGAHEVQWDGRDAGGRVVPAGVYFYRLQAGPWRSERKLIVLQK